MDGKRFDVIAKGPTVVSSHDKPAEAAEAAKAAALAGNTLVEVYDHELKRTIFRARGGEWRWVTR
ncbi:MAG TPA: hypothetical protein VKE22_07515 [Haliangiales bacterium]|nr:hypothetical protein [Haliangiales bacterium]